MNIGREAEEEIRTKLSKQRPLPSSHGKKKERMRLRPTCTRSQLATEMTKEACLILRRTERIERKENTYEEEASSIPFHSLKAPFFETKNL